MPLTADETLELARNFSAMAHVVSQYQIDHWNELNTDDRRKLTVLQRTLIDFSDQYIIISGQLLLNNATNDLNSIQNITTEVQNTVGKLKSIQKVINIVQAVIELGGAIQAKDPAAIVSKIKNVFTTIKSNQEEEYS